jgi:transglutaminase-like putative cysteine protease
VSSTNFWSRTRATRSDAADRNEFLCPRRESNPRPTVPETGALSPELRRQGGKLSKQSPQQLARCSDACLSFPQQYCDTLRTVSSHQELDLPGRTETVFSVAVYSQWLASSKSINFVLDDTPQHPTELVDARGTRLHSLIAGPGRLVVNYAATVAATPEPAPLNDIDRVKYLRPSRYCESDVLTPTARSLFPTQTGHELVQSVRDWVSQTLRYIPGVFVATDGAAHSLLTRRGVCRDYAHLTVALLRAKDVPTRYASMHAPGLSPMDFHAVAEAYVVGAWWVVDSTGFAPRQSLVRIATDRDAADVAFLTNHWADLFLQNLVITATAEVLPNDDHRSPVQLP